MIKCRVLQFYIIWAACEQVKTCENNPLASFALQNSVSRALSATGSREIQGKSIMHLPLQPLQSCRIKTRKLIYLLLYNYCTGFQFVFSFFYDFFIWFLTLQIRELLKTPFCNETTANRRVLIKIEKHFSLRLCECLLYFQRRIETGKPMYLSPFFGYNNRERCHFEKVVFTNRFLMVACRL